MDDGNRAGSGPADCGEALQELYSFLDGQLTPDRRQSIGAHLDHCHDCLEAYDFEAELKQVIAQRCRDEVPPDLRARIARALESPDALG